MEGEDRNERAGAPFFSFFFFFFGGWGGGGVFFYRYSLIGMTNYFQL